jgi:hypothetical protein
MLRLAIKLIEEIAGNSSLMVIELINSSEGFDRNKQVVKTTPYDADPSRKCLFIEKFTISSVSFI